MVLLISSNAQLNSKYLIFSNFIHAFVNSFDCYYSRRHLKIIVKYLISISIFVMNTPTIVLNSFLVLIHWIKYSELRLTFYPKDQNLLSNYPRLQQIERCYLGHKNDFEVSDVDSLCIIVSTA